MCSSPNDHDPAQSATKAQAELTHPWRKLPRPEKILLAILQENQSGCMGV
jgi:hypothetical protein